MNRKETTKFLSDLLISNRLTSLGKYYAREVSIDCGTSNVKWVDFIQFEPAGVIYINPILRKVHSHVMRSKAVKRMFTVGTD